MNERKKHKKRKKTEEQRKEINKSPAPGLYFVMYRASRVLKLLCVVFSIIVKESSVNIWHYNPQQTGLHIILNDRSKFKKIDKIRQ